MKKIFVFVVAALMVCFSALSVSAESDMPRLADSANLLTNEEEKLLSQKLDQLSQELQYDIVIVTVESVGNKSPGRYASDYFKNGGYGLGKDGSGTILLVSMEEGEWYIDYFGDEHLPYAEDMTGYFLADLSYGDYYDAFEGFADGVKEEYVSATTFPFMKNLFIALAIGFVIAFIIVTSMKSKLKTVASRDHAREYVREGSFNLTHERDLYLYSTVRRVAKPQNNSSRGGRSGGRGGGNSSRGGGGRF